MSYLNLIMDVCSGCCSSDMLKTKKHSQSNLDALFIQYKMNNPQVVIDYSDNY